LFVFIACRQANKAIFYRIAGNRRFWLAVCLRGTASASENTPRRLYLFNFREKAMKYLIFSPVSV
jgi:hypothetical protein